MLQQEKLLTMHKRSIKEVLLLGLIFALIIPLLSIQSFSQTPDTITNMIDRLFDDFYPMVTVEYESDSIVILRSGTLAPLWNAIDIVEKESNFTFKQFATTELTIDEKLGPTTVFYVIMSK